MCSLHRDGTYLWRKIPALPLNEIFPADVAFLFRAASMTSFGPYGGVEPLSWGQYKPETCSVPVVDLSAADVFSCLRCCSHFAGERGGH